MYVAKMNLIPIVIKVVGHFVSQDVLETVFSLSWS